MGVSGMRRLDRASENGKTIVHRLESLVDLNHPDPWQSVQLVHARLHAALRGAILANAGELGCGFVVLRSRSMVEPRLETLGRRPFGSTAVRAVNVESLPFQGLPNVGSR